MTVNGLEKFVRVRAENSLSFLQKAFDLYRDKIPFCIERGSVAHPAILALAMDDVIQVEKDLGWGCLEYVPDYSEAIAQIVFTSGTEGAPKAIAITHRNLADVVVRLNEIMEVDDTIREYIGVPVTYSFGLGRARAVSAAGGTFFLPERFDPAEIARMASAGEINAISAVPALWRLILNTPEIMGKAAGAAIRWIEIGSQAMSAEEKREMRRLFPNARIVQHYGLTEASRTTFLRIDSSPDDKLASVGRATGQAEVKIGTHKNICIRGPHVAVGMLSEDGSIVPLIDGDGWLQTKDQGRLSDGVLWYEGRLDDQINVAGVKIGAETLEARINELVVVAPGSFAIGPGTDELRGEIVLLAIVQDTCAAPSLLKEATRVALAEQGVSADGAFRSVEVFELPITGTGKVQRQKLQDLAISNGRQKRREVQFELEPDQEKIAKAWRRIFGNILIHPDDSFYDLGGDSLSAIQIGLTMEAEGYPNSVVKGTLEGRSLSELASDVTTTQQWSLPSQTIRSWSLNLVRGLMVLSVLLSHWGPGVFSRLGIEDITERFLGPIFRMGTPGFATVFGLGLGFFLFPNVLERPGVVRNRLRQSFVLVSTAVVLLAFVRGAQQGLSQDDMLSSEQFAVLFYGILTFYAVALAVAFPVMRWIARRSRPFADCIFGAAALWTVLVLIEPLMAPDSLESPMELLKLLAVRHYSVLRIGGIVLLGLAAGIWYARQTDPAKTSDIAVIAGTGIAFLALLIGGEQEGFSNLARRASSFHSSLVGYIFYAGLAFACLGLTTRIMSNWSSWPDTVRMALRLLIVVGALALPVYAFHGMVLPLADILEFVGMSRAIAVALPMSCFLGGIGWLGFRVWRMYFG